MGGKEESQTNEQDDSDEEAMEKKDKRKYIKELHKKIREHRIAISGVRAVIPRGGFLGTEEEAIPDSTNVNEQENEKEDAKETKERLKDSAGVTESPSVATSQQNPSKIKNKKDATNECSTKQLNGVDKKVEPTSEATTEQGPSKMESKQEPSNEEDSKHWSENGQHDAKDRGIYRDRC